MFRCPLHSSGLVGMVKAPSLVRKLKIFIFLP